MKQALFCLFAIASIVIAGCGGGSNFDFAPVSGTVTMDGKPLADATVMFLPRAEGGIQDAGPASTGRTDASGKFTLTAGEEDGAVVGNHEVMITTVNDDGGDSEDADDDNVYGGEKRDVVPARYNSATTLSFEVPSDGSDAASFELDSTRDEADED